MQLISQARCSYLEFTEFEEWGFLRHGFTLRYQPGPGERVETAQAEEIDLTPGSEKYEHWLECYGAVLGLPMASGVRVKQVHGSSVAVLNHPLTEPLTADAMCTDQTGMPLMMFSADCPLVLVLDPQRPAVGLAHAGWRGVAGRIVPQLVQTMVSSYYGNREKFRAAIFPSICGRCYQVGPEVVEALGGLKQWPEGCVNVDERQAGRWRVDLAGVLRAQLAGCQVPREQIFVTDLCTRENERWFHSYRRDGDKAGRQALIAGLV